MTKKEVVSALRKAFNKKKAICDHARENHTCDSLAWENSTMNANCGDILCAHRDLCKAKTIIRTALSSPLRNCDVGTLEEQVKRMDAYCASHGERIDCGWRCENCPLCSIDRCELAWSQMPYEEVK